MEKIERKLTLTKETIKRLTDKDLELVVGGGGGHPINKTSDDTCCNVQTCANCPSSSS
jgi:carbamate kinase